MRACVLSFLFAVLVCCGAHAFGPATHAYLAIKATGSTNADVVWGAMAPDFAQMSRAENPTAEGALNGLTHLEFGRLAESCFALGFSAHNGTWGADHYAHMVFTADPELIFSVVTIRQLSQEFGIPIARGEDLFEAAMDYMVRVDYGPALGTLIERSAAASGPQNEQAVVDAFAAELAARTAGLSAAQAETLIRNAFRAYIQATHAYGQELKGDIASTRASMLPILAAYMNVDLATAATYFDRAVQLCAGFKTETTRIAGEMTSHLATLNCTSSEGEVEGEGEPETAIDFCTVLYGVSNNPLLAEVGAQYRSLIALLSPDTADLNGPFTVDLTNPANYIVAVQGNQMLDGANELGLLAHILLDPDFNNGVLTHAQVQAAWQHNLDRLRDWNIGTALAPALVPMAPGLLEMLTGYVTLGDGDLSSAEYRKVSGTGSFGFVAGLFSLLNDALIGQLGSGFAHPLLTKEDFVLLPELSADGDADGDGFTNRQEYAYFTPRSCVLPGKSAASVDYVVAALNPGLCPGCAECPTCTATTESLFAVGGNACMAVPGTLPAATAFSWSKDGVGPLAEGRFAGSHCQRLSIVNLQLEDSGTYRCTYGNAKGDYAVTITVAPKVPAWGWGSLLAAGALMAVLAARRWNLRKAIWRRP